MAEEHKNSLVSSIMPDSLVHINSFIGGISGWWHNLGQNIGHMSIELMAWIYQFTGEIILKTPLFIFDNDFFTNMTTMFTMTSISAVTILCMVEGMKRMLPKVKSKGGYGGNKKPMDWMTIGKRWFLVALASFGLPQAFKWSFKFLNFVSDKIMQLGADSIKHSVALGHIQIWDALILLGFDIALVLTLVPLLWKNARRWFDMLMLGICSPLALTAWIFDDYRDHFKTWWSSLKKAALVQVYYSIFLLVIGWIIFGVPTPTTFTGMIIKFLVVLGGFARLSNPPQVFAGKLGNDNTLGQIKDGAVNTFTSNGKKSKKLIASPLGLVDKAFPKLGISSNKAIGWILKDDNKKGGRRP
jgi:hypothetical protein